MAVSELAQHWRRYMVYVIVATVVGAITVAIREVLARLLGEDNRFNYALSVLISYICGIVLSFFGQARVTFRDRRGRQLRRRFSLFVIMAVVSSILTVAISRLLRYEAGFDQLFGAAGAGAAFGLAAVITSVFAYVANARFVFDRETSAVSESK